MELNVRRIFVEKKDGFDIEAKGLYKDLKHNLGIRGIKKIRIINRYDVSGVSDEVFEKASQTIFSEPPVDNISFENIEISEGRYFGVEFLPGQYDQRADSAVQCIKILAQSDLCNVRYAKLIVIDGEITDSEFYKVKSYCINPVEAREAAMEKPSTLDTYYNIPEQVDTLEGFIDKNDIEIEEFRKENGLAMSYEDIKFCRDYFKNDERRNPTITEIKVIDTYWSDHCRHTTFLTSIEKVEFEKGLAESVIKNTYEDYLKSRELVNKNKKKDINLMDIATIAMKELKLKGMLKDLDESEEINACSIVVNVDVDDKIEEWLVMFKNETHNHPTEIEPFGGAATCLGGAIRDPLSGRAYVYQAMRVTGSKDPRGKISDTIPGKLPQKKITTGAASGYSSYGNQIGLATGQVTEIYDDGYVAKRLEIGAVIGAAPSKNVKREVPKDGDVIVLLGGRTGRDGCGGATGSSKAHTEESLVSCGAEVQKGNPPTERKIQRLFRNREVAFMIKRCNDFGAGGVSVAIGELAEGLTIDLNVVPKKYEGLDGTELAISESQERMAVVLDKEDLDRFIMLAKEENLEATLVAVVTEEPRLKMKWNGKNIVDIKREFLNTNGAKQYADACIVSPDMAKTYFDDNKYKAMDIKEALSLNIQDLNVCSQRGLSERFDSTIGAGTVFMPFGGKYQMTPQESMIAKIPVLYGETKTASLMTFGYNPILSKWSPYHGAVYSIVEAVTKAVAAGADYKGIRLTLQEYFERLYEDPKRWGKPLSALLGSFYAQMKLGIPAIGGKDSMSGTFKDMDVPPTLVAFAVGIVNTDYVVSSEFKRAGSKVIIVKASRDVNELPDFEALKKNYEKVYALIKQNKVYSAHTIGIGGVSAAISKMCFGNRIGFNFDNELDRDMLFMPDYGSIIIEVASDENIDSLMEGVEYILLGNTISEYKIMLLDNIVDLSCIQEAFEMPLEKIFPVKTEEENDTCIDKLYNKRNNIKPLLKFAKPKVFIPVFPGTNCEYDTAKAFENAGGVSDIFVFNNLTKKDIEESIKEMIKRIENSQIIMIPGGFSAGDEPEGSGKFIAAVFKNKSVSEAVMKLLKQRDGLMLGICNGFQALIKLGLLPYGEILDMEDNSPTLTFNTIGRHMSRMVSTRITSTLSPWFSNVNEGDTHTIAISHGEGRFIASKEQIKSMFENGQIATQYVDLSGKPTYDCLYNPNGSIDAIEGITSPDGRILGKMGHSERIGKNVCINVPGEKDQKIFYSGIQYFK